MQRTELIQLFRKMATEIAEKDYSHIEETSVIAEIGIDSLGMLELVGEMERQLEVTIPDERLVGIETVAQLMDVVEKYVELKNA